MIQEHRATFGPYLRARRLERGLSLRAAARELGLTPAKLSRMETGKSYRITSTDVLVAFARVYRRPVDEVSVAAGLAPGTCAPATGTGTWRYSAAGGWAPIDDPLVPFEDEVGGDVDTAMRLAGYGPRAFELGQEYGLLVEVHPPLVGAKAPRPGYFVWVNVGDLCESVVCPTLPDLLSLLRELRAVVDPPYVGLAPASGWTAGGKPVGAFALRSDGGVDALVAASRSDESGLVVEYGALRGPNRPATW